MKFNRGFNWAVRAAVLIAVARYGVRELRSDDNVKSASEAIEITLVPEEQLQAEVRQKQILAELAARDRAKLKNSDWAKEWSGSYYAGDGLAMNVLISIAPKSGVAYTWNGCLGLYDGNYGEIVEVFPGGVKVKLAIDPAKSDYKFMSSTLFFVRWGDRRYLVPETRMLDFIANYNEGGTSRERLFGAPRLSNHDALPDEERNDPEPPGRPQLPANFAKFIIAKPTRLKITSVKITDQRDEDAAKDQRSFSYGRPAEYRNLNIQGEVVLDGGRNRGLFVGTKINCDHVSIQLTAVGATTSQGSFAETLRDKSAPSLKSGMEIFLPGAKPDIDDAKKSK